MSLRAFFDITGRHGRLYTFEDGELRDGVPFELGEDHTFYTGDLPGDIEETVVSLPLGMLDFRVLELPLSEPERIREVLSFELDGIILGGAETVVMDAVVTGETAEGKHRVLVAYLDKARLKLILDKLADIGVDPRAVTCLELGHVLRSSPGSENLGSLLLEAPAIEDAERPGLAVIEAERPTIDLRQGEFSYTRDRERARRSFLFIAASLIALALLIAGDIAVRTAKIKKQSAAVEEQVMATYSEVFPGESPGEAQGLSYKMKARLREMKGKEAALRGVSPLGFLMKLTGARPEGVVYTDITLDREYVVLKGEAPSLSDVERAKTSLEGFLKEVKITETGQAVKERVSFTITAREEAI